MRRIPARFHESLPRQIYRVASVDQLVGEWTPVLRYLVKITSEDDAATLAQLAASGIRNIVGFSDETRDCKPERECPIILGQLGSLTLDDVIVPNAERGEISVLFRESDAHHSVLLTNRCNSHCLMCSQPSTRQSDSWLVDEAIGIARYIRQSPASIGLTGGEPLLLGAELRQVIDVYRQTHPDTSLDVLTNGRLLSDKSLADTLLSGLRDGKTSWLVPLYGHADFLHDFIVQSRGAFEETIDGLLALQAQAQPIQLRIVLVKPVLQILPELCRFIGRNLPFVREVALMACEPFGFAVANREICETDLADWHRQLQEAATSLQRADVPFLVMNTPLCVLPQNLWPMARRSISDWKQDFTVECQACALKDTCAGLFAWHNQGWRPGTIKTIGMRKGVTPP